MSERQGRVSSVFGDMPSFVAALERLHGSNWRDLAVYSPVGLPELEHLLPRRGSPVRLIVLIGGVAGGIAGFWLCIGSALLYGLIVGGKWPASLLPYCVIGFELTVLVGGLTAIASVILLARLRPSPARWPYDPGFGEDQFGISVVCAEREIPSVARLLREAGARQVHDQLGPASN